MSESLTSVASWLAVDALFGGGDVPLDPASHDGEAPQPDRYRAFRAVAVVLEMASQLTTGAITVLDLGLRYAASSLIRQLIETEYLLAAFDSDILFASTWAQANPDEIRTSFRPGKMRELGGFSNHEYWRHCDMGGHPSPSGATLLRFRMDAQAEQHAFWTAAVWADLAQHLRRLWASVNHLLDTHHARYSVVRAVDVTRVSSLEGPWEAADPFADPVDLGLLEDVVATHARKGPSTSE